MDGLPAFADLRSVTCLSRLDFSQATCENQCAAATPGAKSNATGEMFLAQQEIQVIKAIGQVEFSKAFGIERLNCARNYPKYPSLRLPMQ